MELSIVTTLYCSEAYLEEFYIRMTRAAEYVTTNYEMILVNDGSPDASLEIALALHRRDPRVKVIDLSRNFGHHKAAMTGLAHAQGELIFQIDVDLEEEPECLPQFFDVFKQAKADVVYGVQERRKGGWFERLTGSVFYTVLNWLSTCKIPPNLLMARLMTKRYVTNLVAHRESELDISNLWVLTGFTQIPVTVRKHSTPGTTYTLGRKVALMLRSVTSSSRKPLVCIAGLGAVILAGTLLYLLYTLWGYLFLGMPASGYTAILLSIWLLGGLILLSLGVIAIYLSVVFTETKNRPYTIIRDIYE